MCLTRNTEDMGSSPAKGIGYFSLNLSFITTHQTQSQFTIHQKHSWFLSGAQDGRVHVWASDSGHKIITLEGNHPGPTKCIGFNPKYMMLASACTNMVSC